jgi:hypothetical protein
MEIFSSTAMEAGKLHDCPAGTMLMAQAAAQNNVWNLESQLDLVCCFFLAREQI